VSQDSCDGNRWTIHPGNADPVCGSAALTCGLEPTRNLWSRRAEKRPWATATVVLDLFQSRRVYFTDDSWRV
jgi:hypothetical protein